MKEHFESLNKEIKHWSGRKFNFSKEHICEEAKESSCNLLYDTLSKKWFYVDEYIEEFSYCPHCGVKLQDLL